MTHPTSRTSSNLQENLFDDFNGSLFHPNVDFPITRTPFYGLFPYTYQLWPLIFTTSSYLILPPRFRFLSITCHYHLRHNSPHTHSTFLFHIWYSNAVTTFETNPYPQQYHFQVHSATAQQQKHIVILGRFL